MLKKQMENYITKNLTDNEIKLIEVEKDYAERHQLLPKKVIVSDRIFHFYVLERCNKETEELILAEESAFLNEKISYFKKNREEFLYVESNDFEPIGVDAIALEFDEVFKTYTALFGLKLQKKFGEPIKTYLDAQLKGSDVKYSVQFSGEDGLWDVNFALDYLDGFNEDMTIREVCGLIYTFVFKLSEAVEDGI